MNERESQQPWTDEEYAFLAEHSAWTSARIARELDRTLKSVQSKRQQIRHGWEPKIAQKSEMWTAEEDGFMLRNPHLTARQVADELDRSYSAVIHRRANLGKLMPTNFGGNTSPNALGSRPLIAKTCKACGLLLQAQWFRLNTKSGSWTSVCGRCRDRSSEHQRNDDRTKAQRKESIERFQALTTPAERAGSDWTSADDSVLADPDLTILQKALKLKRSYKATLIACSRRGYKSKVGLGDPERDQWSIFNPNAAA